jgi:hypothetical protein
MYELALEGTGRAYSSVPDPQGTPLEVAVQLLETRLVLVQKVPDGTTAVLYNTGPEGCPPRRRRRKGPARTVYDEVARFALGELRPPAAARERARTEALASQATR